MKHKMYIAVFEYGDNNGVGAKLGSEMYGNFQDVYCFNDKAIDHLEVEFEFPHTKDQLLRDVSNMNADEAKKLALANKKNLEDQKKVRRDKAHEDEVNLLHKHLMSKVEDAVKQGKLSTEDIKFDADRFSDKVVREVADRLEDDGFHLNKQTHIAYQKVSFTVSWV